MQRRLGGFMYFVIEGPDMAGKTTQTDALAAIFREKNYEVVVTREPGGTVFGEKVRPILKDPEMHPHMTARTKLFLFNAARSQTFHEIILHMELKANMNIVLSDRSFISTIAYQGFGEAFKRDDGEYIREIELDELIGNCEMAMNKIMPKRIFYIDISYEEAMHRKGFDKNREGQKDGFDDRDQQFHLQVREGYEWAVKHYEHLVTRINGERPIEEVTNDIFGHIMYCYRGGRMSI